MPCSAHSLNLVGSCSAECCVSAISFFGFLQTLFNFFSASTHRWCILKSNIHGVVLKSLSTTRWSARSDAVNALKTNFIEIRSALIQLADDKDQTTITRREAFSLVSKMENFKTALLCVVWECILNRLNATSKSLQRVETDLATCTYLYECLFQFVISLRNEEIYEEFEEKAKILVKDNGYRADHQRLRKKKRFFEEADTEAELSPRNKFKTSTYFAILDSLASKLRKRKEIFSKLQKKFWVSFQYHNSGRP